MAFVPAFGFSSCKAASPLTKQQNKLSQAEPRKFWQGLQCSLCLSHLPTSMNKNGQGLRRSLWDFICLSNLSTSSHKNGQGLWRSLSPSILQNIAPNPTKQANRRKFWQGLRRSLGVSILQSSNAHNNAKQQTREKKLLRLAGCVTNAEITNKAGETDSPDKLEQLMDSGPSSGKNFGSASGAAYAF